MFNRMVPSSKKAPKGILKTGVVAPALPASELCQSSPKANPAARLRIGDFVRHEALDMSSTATSSRTTWLGQSNLYDRSVGRVYLDGVEYFGLIPPDRLNRQFVLPETCVLTAEFPDASPIVFDMDGVAFTIAAEDMRLADHVSMFLRRRVYPQALMRDPDLELIADVIVYHCDGRDPQRMWFNTPVLNAVLNDYAKRDPAAYIGADFNWKGVLTYLMVNYSLPNRLWLLAADRVPLDCYGYQGILAQFSSRQQSAESAALASAFAPDAGAASSGMPASVSAGIKRRRAGYSSDESEGSSIECPATTHVESPMESSPLGGFEGTDALCFLREPPKITRDRFAVAALQL